MLLSVVIINYNTFQLTCECLRSIKETAHLEHEIILVDNNSRECAAEKFLDLFPGLCLVALKENLGYGRANNLAVEKAKGKYVLLLNSDTVLQANTLDETVAYLEKNPQVDVLGCKVLFENDTVQTTVVKDEQQHRFLPALKFLVKRNSFFVETRLFFQNRKANKPEREAMAGRLTVSEQNNEDIKPNYYMGRRIGSLVGVFLLLKRSVYQASKGFDPDFFLYYEEIEWFVKRLRGYNIVYYPNVSLYHHHAGSDVHKTGNLQFYVSQHLFWYKMGYLQYAFYLFFQVLDVPSRLLTKYVYRRKRLSEDLPAIIRSFMYSFRVLQYSNRYGSRRDALKLRYLQKHNF